MGMRMKAEMEPWKLSLALCPYATRRVTLVESRKTREGECSEKRRKTETWKERKEKHKKS